MKSTLLTIATTAFSTSPSLPVAGAPRVPPSEIKRHRVATRRRPRLLARILPRWCACAFARGLRRVLDNDRDTPVCRSASCHVLRTRDGSHRFAGGFARRAASKSACGVRAASRAMLSPHVPEMPLQILPPQRCVRAFRCVRTPQRRTRERHIRPRKDTPSLCTPHGCWDMVPH